MNLSTAAMLGIALLWSPLLRTDLGRVEHSVAGYTIEKWVLQPSAISAPVTIWSAPPIETEDTAASC